MFSSRVSASRGVLEWIVPIEPSWPVFIACSMSMASSPRISPRMIRSGRMRSAFLTRWRMVISPSPSMLAGRVSRRTTCGCCSCSSAASSIVTVRSPWSIIRRHGVEERGLARAGAAGDEDVEPRAAGDLQHRRHVGGDVVLPRHHVERDLLLGELADRDGRPVDGERRDDDVDAAAVLEAGVDQRGRFVDPAAHLGHDAGGHVQHVRVVAEDGRRSAPPCPCARRRPGAGR